MHVPDHELENLLAYDRERMSMSLDGEFVASFRVWRIPASQEIPHGIRYALNMHGPPKKGLLNDCYCRFDNAHGIKTSGHARVVAWDHKHRMMNDPVPYNFTTCHQLLADFFAMANQILDDLGVAR